MHCFWLYAYPQPDLDAFGCREDKPMVAIVTEMQAPFAHCAIARCTKFYALALALPGRVARVSDDVPVQLAPRRPQQ